jgi:hypothetical protein
LHRVWASRSWIVQESLFNDNMEMACERINIQWDLLPRIARLASTGDLPEAALYGRLEEGNVFNFDSGSRKHASHLVTIAELRSAQAEGRLDMPLLYYLASCIDMDSTDPRDKVYAFLGIASDREKLGIVPNYAATVSEVYLDAAARILQTAQHLDLLNNVQTIKSVELPSWVPDWSQGCLSSQGTLSNPVGFAMIAAFNGLHPYQANGGTTASVSLESTRTRLTLHGCIIDNVSYAVGYPKNSLDGDMFQTFAWVKEQMNVTRNLPMYSTEHKVVDAFSRTLVANLTPEGQ